MRMWLLVGCASALGVWIVVAWHGVGQTTRDEVAPWRHVVSFFALLVLGAVLALAGRSLAGDDFEKGLIMVGALLVFGVLVASLLRRTGLWRPTAAAVIAYLVQTVAVIAALVWFLGEVDPPGGGWTGTSWRRWSGRWCSSWARPSSSTGSSAGGRTATGRRRRSSPGSSSQCSSPSSTPSARGSPRRSRPSRSCSPSWSSASSRRTSQFLGAFALLWRSGDHDGTVDEATGEGGARVARRARRADAAAERTGG